MANVNCAMSTTTIDSANLASARNIALDQTLHTVSAKMAIAAVAIAICIRQTKIDSTYCVAVSNAATANEAIADDFAINEFAFVSGTRNFFAELRNCFDYIDAAAVDVVVAAAPSFDIMTPILQTNPSFYLFLSPLQTEVFFGANY